MVHAVVNMLGTPARASGERKRRGHRRQGGQGGLPGRPVGLHRVLAVPHREAGSVAPGAVPTYGESLSLMLAEAPYRPAVVLCISGAVGEVERYSQNRHVSQFSPEGVLPWVFNHRSSPPHTHTFGEF